jgi:hypothetical protein
VTKKRLNLVKPKDQALGRPTVMDRALAQRYGVIYVHTAAFAIDLDRVRELDTRVASRPQGSVDLPFAWEVWLLERHLGRVAQGPAPLFINMLEEACLQVMDLPASQRGTEPPFGSQLPFAVYAGVARGRLPNKLGSCFHLWKKPPVDLLDDLAELDRVPGLGLKLVEHCLAASITPPLVAPVREALVELFDDASAV